MSSGTGIWWAAVPFLTREGAENMRDKIAAELGYRSAVIEATPAMVDAYNASGKDENA